MAKERIALVFGTFAPLHQGHIDLIQRAKRQCDRAYVLVSGYQGDRGDLIGLNLQKRFRYIREFFADDELTKVFQLDETSMPRYPQGWSQWLTACLEAVGYKEGEQDLIFYVSEAEYEQELTKRGFEVALSQRSFGISASQIRQEPEKYWRYIAQTFHRHFTKKVLIIGSASNGKTTLAKDLGRFYGAPVSLEYAREYQMKNNVLDAELVPKDYYYFLLGQYDQTSQLIDSATNRGLVIADTNALVTKAYYDYYLKDYRPENGDKDAFEHLFEAITAKEQWDLILFIMPNGAYVDDGFRDMTMADQKIRQDFTAYLDAIRHIHLADVPVIYLDGNYDSNYKKAKEAIEMVYRPG